MKLDYCLCDLTGVETLKKAAAVNTAFLFCWSECALGLFLSTTLKILNDLKRKQTFYVTWINFLINYLNFTKESLQKQLLTEQIFFEIGVLKNFGIFRGKHLCWSVFLIKLQACNFPVNITKFLRTAFFIKHLWWLLLKNP